MQQSLPGGQQNHEHTGLLLTGQIAHGIGQRRGHLDLQAGGAVPGLAGAWVVGAQVQYRQVLPQLADPVVALARRFTGGQPVALPLTMVGVPDRQDVQGQRLPVDVGGIQAGELVQQDIQRPAVGDDVMQGHPQLVFVIGQPRQGHAQQRPLAQVERANGLLLALGAHVGRREAFEVTVLECEDLLRQDRLYRLALDLVEACAQCFVSRHQGLEAGTQRRFVQLAPQVQPGGDVVGRRLRFQLPEQPQAILRQRLGHWPGTVESLDAVGQRDTGLTRRFHRSGIGRQRRVLEQGPYAQAGAQCLVDARGDLGRENGVAAQQQEVIVGADRVEAEHVAPDVGDVRVQVIEGSLGGVGLHIRREARIAVQAALLQALTAGRALQLAAGGLWQRAGVEQQDHGRRLVADLGDGLAHGLDQRGGRLRLLDAATDLHRDADALLAPVVDREHRDPPLAQSRDLALQSLLQVLGVEVLAADDQHVLETPGDEQLPVALETQVAGAQPGLPVALDEGPGGGFGVAPVAQGDARASGPDFTHVVVRQAGQGAGVDDLHRMPGLAVAAAHQHAALARFDAVGGERLGVQRQRGNALTAAAAADEQGRFGQTIAGEELLGPEAAGAEGLGEGRQAVLADRLGAGVGHAPAAQVEPGQGGLADPFAAQPVGEVRAAADGAAVVADRLQPAQGPGEEVPRRHQHTGHAAEDGLQQPADQPHVVVQR